MCGDETCGTFEHKTDTGRSKNDKIAIIYDHLYPFLALKGHRSNQHVLLNRF